MEFSKEGIIIFYFIIGLIFILLISHFFYQRNSVIKRVPCVDVRQDQWDEKQVIVDFRDYNNLSDSFVFQDAIFIPIPYLKRYYHEIPSKYVHVIASNKLEINIGIRFLQKHGFHVTGYSLAECSCHNKTTEITM